MGLESVSHNFLTGRLEDMVQWARKILCGLQLLD